MGNTKIDNHNPAAKLELRRYFLRKYHADDPPHVLDCCQGGGVLWRELQKEFTVASYWGVDVKPKKGRLKLDSVRILSQSGWPQNVVDIDTYGSPWKHWAAMLPNIVRPVTVFLTYGGGVGGGGCVGTQRIGMDAKTAVGLGRLAGILPAGFEAKLQPLIVSACLTRCGDYGLIIQEAIEAESDGNARYVGVRLEPRTKSGRLRSGNFEPA